MKLRVDLTWNSGIVEPGDPPPPDPDFELYDTDTGRALSERVFRSYEEMEAHIAAFHADCERWVPPVASAEEAARLDRVLQPFASGKPGDRRAVRHFLIGQLYQYGHPESTVARIRATLEELA